MVGWITGTKLGRWVAMGTIIALIAVVALDVFRRSAESTGRAKERIDALTKTLEVVDAMRRASPADRAGMRRRLSKGRWAD